VLHVENNAGPQPLQPNANRVAELMASHNAGQRLEQLVEGRGGPDSTTRLASGGTVASILERAAQSENDLIVLGARHRSDLGWQFRDDIARQVSALAPCATLTVHDRDGADRIERILVPVDFGPVTARALAWALVFAQKFSAQVHVLHVLSREGQPERSVDRSRKSARPPAVPADVGARITELAEELAGAGVQATSDVTIASGVINGITDCNERRPFDLLVLGLSGPPRGAPRLTRGVAATLRNRMSIPVLSVRQANDDSPNSASGTGGR
ncbi:MAG TPA: universal stress protein, partial [Polyangiaceae bacterium]|jgi:nucleotide-binding universal stress UspA family protein|nr:universal stress protein [Polyangiaceae bacterium]